MMQCPIQTIAIMKKISTMKKLLITICFLISIPFISFESSVSKANYVTSDFSYRGIENGWYQATVKCVNYSTYNRSTYTLNVKVEYDRVTEIDFGNGGSVHSGYNNSGYFYSGGYLNMERDYDYNIVAATTKVTITEENSNIITFDIRIE